MRRRHVGTSHRSVAPYGSASKRPEEIGRAGRSYLGGDRLADQPRTRAGSVRCVWTFSAVAGDISTFEREAASEGVEVLADDLGHRDGALFR